MNVYARAVTLSLAATLLGAANAPSTVGFAKLATLVSRHPLAGMLAQYDREIAALRSTTTIAALRDPAGRAERSGTIVQQRIATGKTQLDRIANAPPQQDVTSERAALADVANAQRTGDSALATYRDELANETSATLRDYAAAMAQRNDRALAAREQQLREKELTLGFDAAKRNAGARLALRLRLQDLHLNAAKRRLLENELAELNRSEQRVVAAQARRNAGILTAYRQTLARDGDAQVAALAAALRSKAQANLALRLRVSGSESATAAVVPNLSQRMHEFATGYSGARTVNDVAATLRATARDLPAPLRAVAQADRQSASQTAAQIATLQRDRSQLYRSIVAHIERLAQRLAQQRGLRQVVVAQAAPRGSVDVTAAVAAMLRSL